MKFTRIIPLCSIIVIIVLGFGVYITSLAGSFLPYDDSLISGNPVIKSWSNISAVFVKETIPSYESKLPRMYRPIQMITYMADYFIWGLRPIGYHLTNVLLHLLTALSLYWFVSLLTSGKFIPFVTSVFFVIHPVQAESVAYISGRAGPLSVLFAMVCFVMYIKYTRREKAGFFILAFIAFILALLSSENMIILPALFIAYNYSFRTKSGTKLIIALTITAVSYALLRLILVKSLFSDFNIVFRTTLVQRLPGFFVAVTDYCRLLISPGSARMEYGDRIFHFADPAALFGAIILILLLYAAFKLRRSNPLATFAISWFLIALLPVSNIYPVGAYMAEQWLYLPSIGFFLIAGILLKSLCVNRYFGVVVAIAVTALLVRYSYITMVKNFNWHDPVVYYKQTLRNAPESIKANNDMATAYEKAGRYDEASGIYNGMLKQNPDHPGLYVNLAAIQIIKGNSDKAITLCEKAIALSPTNATAHNNLAVAYYVEGEYSRAIYYCDLALKYGYKVKPELLELLRPYRE
ncbi:MAG: tetratricopeptide repeat protein [Candidatus Omnitrophica bacterium]|nr:tetratricopeptide repeat protein [Candidatus Omnitrophota bacterium]